MANRLDFDPRADVVAAQAAVTQAPDDAAAVRGEADRPTNARRQVPSAHDSSRLRLPNDDRPLAVHGHDEAAVRCKRDGANISTVAHPRAADPSDHAMAERPA